MRKQMHQIETALFIDATRHNLESFIAYIDVFHVRMAFQAVRLFYFFLKTGVL